MSKRTIPPPSFKNDDGAIEFFEPGSLFSVMSFKNENCPTYLYPSWQADTVFYDDKGIKTLKTWCENNFTILPNVEKYAIRDIKYSFYKAKDYIFITNYTDRSPIFVATYKNPRLEIDEYDNKIVFKCQAKNRFIHSITEDFL